MERASLTIVTDASVGDWIRESLTPWVPFTDAQMTIGFVIPKGFQSYVLIRHAGEGDHQGALGSATLETLLTVLSKFTTADEDCYFAMWEGFSWGNPGVPLTAVRRPKLHRFVQQFALRFGRIPHRSRRQTYVPPFEDPELHTLPVGIMKSERFKLPYRDYLLAKGSLFEGPKIGRSRMGWFHPQSPNLIWPSDRSWILATEIDHDVTLIAGSEKLVEAILNTDSLTAERFLVTDTIEKLRVAKS